ncbi:MAG: GMC family oxidoreductase N-terminal domain-containing protein [Aggregatilineales bacterium]
MVFLSEKERETLTVICDTLVPAVSDDSELMKYNPSADGLIPRLEIMLEEVTSEEDQRDLKLLLNALNNRFFNGISTGKWASLNKMSLKDREDLLSKWANSPIPLQRKAYKSVKSLSVFLAYTNNPDKKKQPFWSDVDYPGPPGGSDDAHRIQPFVIRDNRTLYTDVLIIGSGAGGGVVAGELSAAGYDVIVAEKGGHHEARDFDGNELRATSHLFEHQGALTSADGEILILAGATLGGGTTVNWNASFIPPDHVRREWANEYGFTGAITDAYTASMHAVCERVNVNTDESVPNPNNRNLEAGCKALGYNVDTIPRNVKGCEECGFCNYGCSFGAKQGTLKTYLQDAYDRGTRIMVQATARRVMHEAGKVTGAILDVQDESGDIQTLTVRAKLVVVSAGSIHTPVILKRSGLQNKHIGEHLHLHPVVALFSVFDDPVKTWQGAPMTRICKDFMNLDGNGYGVALEVAPAHPGLSAAIFPWQNAESHKTLVSKMPYMSNLIALTRDYYGGRVKLDRYGNPVVHYKLHPYDRKHLQQGLLEGLKIHYAAGAREIYAPHNRFLKFDRDSGESFPRFLRKVEDEGLKPYTHPIFTAHQMSSSRIAGNERQGAIKPNGESWEVENLFVADASVLPTATGVNPMISIMTTAHYIAQQIKAKLN